MKKIYLILLFICFINTANAQRYVFYFDLRFNNASYNCKYAENSCGDVVVDTIMFDFTVDYKDDKTLEYMLDDEFKAIRVTFGYIENGRLTYINTIFTSKLNKNNKLELIEFDYDNYWNYKLHENKQNLEIYPKENNKFVCKIKVKDLNIPTIHLAYIGYNHIENQPNDFDETENDLYFGKLKKEDALKFLIIEKY